MLLAVLITFFVFFKSTTSFVLSRSLLVSLTSHMVYLFILHFAAYRVTFQSAFLCSPSPYLPYLNNPVSIIDKVVISACSLIDCLCFLSISIPRLSKFVFLFFHILFVIYPYSCMLLLLTCIPYFQLSLLSDTLVYRLCYLPLCCVLLAVGSLCACTDFYIFIYSSLLCSQPFHTSLFEKARNIDLPTPTFKKD